MDATARADGDTACCSASEKRRLAWSTFAIYAVVLGYFLYQLI